MNLPFNTLPDLLQYFNNEDKCRTFLEKTRWPDGNIICPICGATRAYRNGDCKTYKCRNLECKMDFSVTVGTMMQSTKLPLAKWYAAIWLITRHRISQNGLRRKLELGSKTAWHLIKVIKESGIK